MRLALLTVALLSGCASLGPGVDNLGYFGGRVTDEAGNSLPGVNVVLPELGGEHPTGAASDRDGLFAIGPVPQGRHEAEVRYPGMHSERFAVVIGARPTTRTIVLRRDTSVVEISVCGAAC